MDKFNLVEKRREYHENLYKIDSLVKIYEFNIEAKPVARQILVMKSKNDQLYGIVDQLNCYTPSDMLRPPSQNKHYKLMSNITRDFFIHFFLKSSALVYGDIWKYLTETPEMLPSITYNRVLQRWELTVENN